MAMLPRVLVAAAIAAAVSGQPAAIETSQFKDAICSGSSCASEGDGAGVGLLQIKASTQPALRAIQELGDLVAKLPPMVPSVSSLLQSFSGLKDRAGKLLKKFDCEKWPQYCGEPLYCDKVLEKMTFLEEASWYYQIAEGDHTNLKIWCLNPGQYANGIIKECLKDHNLEAAAPLTYEDQKEKNCLEADGSYCFLAGHCDNDKVNDNTTIAEAEAMCDAKYTRQGWSRIGFKDMHTLGWMIEGKVSLKSGFHDRETANFGAKLACAMGNYHCDVVYCREMYCNNPYYVKKYGSYKDHDPPPLAVPFS